MTLDRDPEISQRSPSVNEPSAPAPQPPLPRPERSGPKSPRRSQNLDRLFLNRRGELSWDQVTGFRGGARRDGHRLIFWSFMAVLIDALILVSLSSFFVLAFALIVRSPFANLLNMSMIAGAGASVGATKMFIYAFILSSWVYMLTLRIFFGFSIGEWACDLRLGQPTERVRRSYPLKVFARTSLILLTGLVTLPALSVLFGRDLSGALSGVRLISLR
jgi:hypothetical protein